jgi:hypothetical protein
MAAARCAEGSIPRAFPRDSGTFSDGVETARSVASRHKCRGAGASILPRATARMGGRFGAAEAEPNGLRSRPPNSAQACAGARDSRTACWQTRPTVRLPRDISRGVATKSRCVDVRMYGRLSLPMWEGHACLRAPLAGRATLPTKPDGPISGATLPSGMPTRRVFVTNPTSEVQGADLIANPQAIGIKRVADTTPRVEESAESKDCYKIPHEGPPKSGKLRAESGRRKATSEEAERRDEGEMPASAETALDMRPGIAILPSPHFC